MKGQPERQRSDRLRVLSRGLALNMREQKKGENSEKESAVKIGPEFDGGGGSTCVGKKDVDKIM